MITKYQHKKTKHKPYPSYHTQNIILKGTKGTSLAVQWLKLHASTAGGINPWSGSKDSHMLLIAARGEKRGEKKSKDLNAKPRTIKHTVGKYLWL